MTTYDHLITGCALVLFLRGCSLTKIGERYGLPAERIRWLILKQLAEGKRDKVTP